MKKLPVFLVIMILFTSSGKKELLWVAIGDSITYLNDHLDETGNRVSKGFLTRVTERLPHLKYVNQGHNGWTSGGIAEKIDQLQLVRADVYTIFLGTNDWWSGRPLGQLSDYINHTGNGTVNGSFHIIINKLRSLNPQAKIILLTPMQRADFVYINDFTNNAYGSYRNKNDQSLEQFAAAIQAIGDLERLPTVDLYHAPDMELKKLVRFKRLKDPQTGAYKDYPYPDYIDVPFNPLVDNYPYPVEAADITYDGLHPSDKGYAAITSRLVKILKKY